MENIPTTVYLGLFIALLAVAAWFIFRQVIKTRKVESTLARLEKKLQEEKGTAEEYYELGCIYLDKKIFTQAIAVLQRALKVEALAPPEASRVYNALGYAYSAQEQYDLAIRQYKEAIKLAPDYVVALNNLGFAYEKKKLTAQALEIYEQALQYDANNATAKRRAESMRKRLIPSS